MGGLKSDNRKKERYNVLYFICKSFRCGGFPECLAAVDTKVIHFVILERIFCWLGMPNEMSFAKHKQTAVFAGHKNS